MEVQNALVLILFDMEMPTQVQRGKLMVGSIDLFHSFLFEQLLFYITTS